MSSPLTRTHATKVVTGLLIVLTLAGALLTVLSVNQVDPLKSGPLGLIEGMPFQYLAGIALMLVAFGIALTREHLNRPLLAAQIFLVILALYGVASLTEGVARLPTGWVHAGFIDHIQRNDHILEDYDARFVWPGFFAFGAMLNELAGTLQSDDFLAWAPLVQVLLYAVPVWVIARGIGAPLRAAWLATMLFMLLNWVGQDYYSPQGINMLFALCFLAVLIRVFFSDSPLVPPWLRGLTEPLLASRAPNLLTRLKNINLTAAFPDRIRATGKQEAALVGALVICFIATVVSHQLTPFFVIVVTASSVILNRLKLRVFPVFMLIGVLVWISYAAAPFWVGKLEALFGDVGNVDSTLNQNVANRVKGDPAHIPVIYGRLALAGTLWLAAVAGVIRRLRTGKADVLCVVGFLSPFTILGGQAYGGEAVLRVYLFALPFTATLAAMLIAPREDRWKLPKGLAVCALLVALVPTFFITRYGNEAFEAFSTKDYELVTEAMQMAPDNARMLSVNSQLPWRYERISTMQYFAITDDGIPDNLLQHAETIVAQQTDRPVYFILSRAQDTYCDIVQGLGKHYATDLGQTLVNTGQWRIAFENEQGMIVVPVGQP